MSPAGLILNSEWFCGILSKNFETLLSVEIRKFIYGLLIFRKYFLFTILSKNYIRNSKFCVDFPFNFFDNNLNGKQNRLISAKKGSLFIFNFYRYLFFMIWIFLVFGQNLTKQALVLGLGPTPIRRWRNVTYLHYFCNHVKYSSLVLHECNWKSSNTAVFKKERNGNVPTFFFILFEVFIPFSFFVGFWSMKLRKCLFTFFKSLACLSVCRFKIQTLACLALPCKRKPS